MHIYIDDVYQSHVLNLYMCIFTDFIIIFDRKHIYLMPSYRSRSLDAGAYVYIDSIKVYLAMGTENLFYSNTSRSRSDVVKYLNAQILQNSINLGYPHCLGLGPIYSRPRLGYGTAHMCMQYTFYTHVHACTYIKCKFNLFQCTYTIHIYIH